MKCIFQAICFVLFQLALNASGQEVPRVYDKEFTGADVPKPALPEFADLKAVSHLPDPFMKADGKRVATKDEWRVRRAAIGPTRPMTWPGT